jgi:hypothetical protein
MIVYPQLLNFQSSYMNTLILLKLMICWDWLFLQDRAGGKTVDKFFLNY